MKIQVNPAFNVGGVPGNGPAIGNGGVQIIGQIGLVLPGLVIPMPDPVIERVIAMEEVDLAGNSSDEEMDSDSD